MSKQESDRRIRLLLAGARLPLIAGASMTMREMERAFEDDPSIDLAVFDLSNIRGKGLLGLCRYAWILVKLFRSAWSADALFLFTIGSGLPWTLFPMWLIAFVTRTKLIVRCGGGTAHTHGSTICRLLVRKILKRASLYVVQTRMLCDDARSAGIACATALPNGRDLSQAVRAEHPYSARWVLLGRLVPTKGVCETIEAFRSMPELSLDLVGPADTARLGEDKGVDLDRMDLPPNVRWLGERSPEQIPRLLAGYDGFVFPSYYSTEGHPGVLIEAMAAGLPVVTTRFRAIPEIVDDQCGFLVEPRDVDGIVKSIRALDENPELRARLRLGSLERSKSFDWRQLSQRCRELVVQSINQDRS